MKAERSIPSSQVATIDSTRGDPIKIKKNKLQKGAKPQPGFIYQQAVPPPP